MKIIVAIKNYKWNFNGRIQSFEKGMEYSIKSAREVELMVIHGYAKVFENQNRKIDSKSEEKKLDVQTENKMMDSAPENKNKKSSKWGRPKKGGK